MLILLKLIYLLFSHFHVHAILLWKVISYFDRILKSSEIERCFSKRKQNFRCQSMRSRISFSCLFRALNAKIKYSYLSYSLYDLPLWGWRIYSEAYHKIYHAEIFREIMVLLRNALHFWKFLCCFCVLIKYLKNFIFWFIFFILLYGAGII